MSNTWSVVDPYFRSSQGGERVDAEVFWRPKGNEEPWYASGPVQAFGTPDGQGGYAEVGLEGDLYLPVLNFRAQFQAIHLRIAQLVSSGADTQYELSALPLGSGPQERFDDAWQAATSTVYMEEEPGPRGGLGAVVTLDKHFHIFVPFKKAKLQAATHVLDK